MSFQGSVASLTSVLCVCGDGDQFDGYVDCGQLLSVFDGGPAHVLGLAWLFFAAMTVLC